MNSALPVELFAQPDSNSLSCTRKKIRDFSSVFLSLLECEVYVFLGRSLQKSCYKTKQKKSSKSFSRHLWYVILFSIGHILIVLGANISMGLIFLYYYFISFLT